MSKPKPIFEGQLLEWRKPLYIPYDGGVEKEPLESDKITHREFVEYYQAQRHCEGGELHWVLLLGSEVDAARERSLNAIRGIKVRR